MKNPSAILITGAAKRVGAHMAEYFAAQGHEIALHYNHSEAAARDIQSRIQSAGGTCHLFQLDLQNTAAIPALMQSVKAKLPHVGTLINNASVFERGSLMETTEDLFDRQMNINFKAPFFLTQSFAATFGKGNVINILDTDIVQTAGSHFAYLLSKKSLADFTQMAARELGPNIRVNAVCPGILLPSDGLDEAYIAKLSPMLPLENIATLNQLCSTILWLSQNPVTGQMIYTDGGQHLL